MVFDMADQAGLALAELADCEDCGVRPGESPRAWSIAACERHSALLERESTPGRLVADGGEPDPQQFAIPTIEELDEMRVAADLNQRDLSRRAGMEPGRWNHILHGDVDPHVSTLRAFLRAVQEATDRDEMTEPEHGPDPQPSPHASGRERCWDNETCPTEGCDGDLEQQDRLNVICLECDFFAAHSKDDGEHRLVRHEEVVARKPRAVADGGITYRDVRGVMSAVDVDRPEWAESIAVGDEIAFEAPPDGEVQTARVIGFSSHDNDHHGCPVIQPDAELRQYFADDPDQIAITREYWRPGEVER